MFRRISSGIFAVLMPIVAVAQIEDEFRRLFDDFSNQSIQEFADFRQQANMEYVDFLQAAWVEFKASPAVEKPEEKIVPLKPTEPDAQEEPRDNPPIKIKEIIMLPPPLPRPEPLSIPVVNSPKDNNRIKPDGSTLENFNNLADGGDAIYNPLISNDDSQKLIVPFYGTEMAVRISENINFEVKISEKDVARIWKILTEKLSDETLYDCLELRKEYGLSDWAYLRLLDAISDKWLGKDTNESELLKAFLYCQSGYQMRLAFAKDRLVMLYASPYTIYGKIWWKIDGMQYYCDNEQEKGLSICTVAFPGEKPLSTAIETEQQFFNKQSPQRELSATDGLSVTSEVNVNYIDFCNEYPSSQYGDNPITRWALYANAPASKQMKSTLYPQLRQALQGLNQYDAVNRLCNWVQTAFEYEYDDVVWGADRAFFADETLYYPYCDCEDRSILLTRMVRDLLGLKCALIYYPGHLATAVALGEDASGDYIRLGDEKYLVCDPTYINASIGRTMPDLDNNDVQVMVLD